jgi:hypothetical protein
MKTRLPIAFCCPGGSEASEVVRLMLQHHDALTANGWESYVVSPSARALSRWTGLDASSIRTEPPGRCIRVVSGSDPENLRRAGRKVILARSPRIDDPESEDSTWRGNGEEAIIAVGPYVKASIQLGYDVPTTIVSPSVNRTVFRPGPKFRTIAYMPKRDSPDDYRIRDLCRLPDFEWRSVSGLPQARAGEILSRSAIYLTTCPPEDFGLAALEAMSSGCVVVGYATEGGKDFMEDGSNCLLVPPGDCERAAHTVELAARLFEEGRVGDLTEAALGTAKRFSPGRQAADLIKFWSSESAEELLARPISGDSTVLDG